MSSSRSKLAGAAVAWVLVVLLFWKAIYWLAAAATVREQVSHAAVVLIFGLVFLLRERPGGNPLALAFGPRAKLFYLGACGSAALAGVFQEPAFMLLGLGFLSGAVLLFVLGDGASRVALGFGLAFTAFTLVSVVFPLADWPLRVFAGQTAEWLLGLLGQSVDLRFSGQPAQLILISAGRPFMVAPECNGFGIISGGLLLAVLLVFSRRLRWLDKAIVLLLAPLVGLLSNAIRIVVIVLLAPLVGDHYFVMHEAVGIVLFFGTLGFIWWLVDGLPERGRRIGPAVKCSGQ